MDLISPKERLFRTLDKKETDRKPIICPGGMMNAAVVDVMTKCGHLLPKAHSDDTLMAQLSKDVSDETGFENYGLPFCMTVEAEVLGSEIDFGSLECEPKIKKEVFPHVSEVDYKDINKMLKEGRIETITNAAYKLSKNSDVPVIGSLTGPISTADSIVDPMTFLKELRKDKENANKVTDYVTDFLIEYAKQLIESGADVISIADPTATGEILGPKMFGEYAVKYLNKLIDAIHETGTRVILHICGNMKKVDNYIPLIHMDAISTDAMVNLSLLKEKYPQLTTMGNLSTYLLESGDREHVIKATERLLAKNIDIIAPACGLSTSSPIENLQAFTRRVKEK
ncbi:[methyl-Co(III) methanol-specific corrinoid protein]:coenzyme M methyltransferase [Acetitomaculum ruminis DSM 5522]|uniref:[methyl-Co(III) methanol-specific corrinoid protein]:coenzyme M methyltransferase n=1 Tax=Acetitomaculum ruminis DSM 5522 TaxID=1120918 RepID=A0A1I1A1P4_9FIRM|nr:uroporphyrinogen decarboxylase family protein [Acetitomaculum ruminis]SFB31899.1 [methyl-Co(III) methanol-specific corrinoid protein]:coenzyme M methyltransferase [Acetitomaculum ruminis DSM 5522]